MYHPEYGFYSSGGHAGRRGDFLTSPEVGPLFGHVVANALDAEWERLGQPDSFTVIDYGAGPGTLARSVFAASPRCAEVMRYIAVERSEMQRALHPEFVLSVDEDEIRASELFASKPVGVVIANELLDNLSFAPVTRVEGRLHLLDVVLDGDRLATTPALGALDNVESFFDASVSQAVLQAEAASWFGAMHSTLRRGRILVIDYARLRSIDVEIRTYADHGRAGDPLEALGTKDITVDVDLEQLQRRVGPADQLSTQAEWLRSHGIDALVEEGQRMWKAGASTGSLEALKARSRVREAEALTETEGLGGFMVAEWVIA